MCVDQECAYVDCFACGNINWWGGNFWLCEIGIHGKGWVKEFFLCRGRTLLRLTGLSNLLIDNIEATVSKVIIELEVDKREL